MKYLHLHMHIPKKHKRNNIKTYEKVIHNITFRKSQAGKNQEHTE